MVSTKMPVVDAAVRSWPPLEPRCLRWEFPVWQPDEYLAPADLKFERSNGRGRSQEQAKPETPEWTAESFAKKFVDPVNRVTDEIVWRVEGDRRVGKLSVDVNARISLTGTLTLSPSGDRCRFVQEFTAKVNVPLVGGRIAKKVEEETHKAVTSNCEFTSRDL